MRLNELPSLVYTWVDAHATQILVGALVYPVLSTALARLGKGGRTDSDGKIMASAAVAGSVIFCGAAVLLLLLSAALGASIGEANLLLLLAPPLCLLGTLLGVRWVFPLGELRSVRSLWDIGAFTLACAAGLWLLSQFRGWGIVFYGSIFEMLIIVGLGYRLLRGLFRRAFAAGTQDPSAEGPALAERYLAEVRRMQGRAR